MKKLLLFVATIALAFAGTKPKAFTVSLATDERAGSVVLKAGDYKAAFVCDTLTLTQGKNVVVIAPAHVVAADKKFTDTSVLAGNGKLEEIRVGGTKARVVLD